MLPGLAVRRSALVLLVAGAFAAAAQQQPPTKTVEKPGSPRPEPDPFAAEHAGLEGASTEDCLGCHAEGRAAVQAHASHPVGLVLDDAAARSKGQLRAAREVRARGVALEDGKIGCLTCHALASPYKHRIALPPGAEVRRAAVPGDKRTYDPELAESAAAPGPGAAVSTKPLCQACHVH